MDNLPILKEILVQIFGFAIVFFILKKLAWKNILGVIDQRRQKIESDFEGIEKQKKALEALEKDYRDRLEHIEQEARAKIQEAAHVGINLARDIQEKARLDAQKMIERAQGEIAQEIEKSRVQVRNEIVELSSLVAGKIIRQKLDTKEHERMIRQFIQDLEKVN